MRIKDCWMLAWVLVLDRLVAAEARLIGLVDSLLNAERRVEGRDPAKAAPLPLLVTFLEEDGLVRASDRPVATLGYDIWVNARALMEFLQMLCCKWGLD